MRYISWHIYLCLDLAAPRTELEIYEAHVQFIGSEFNINK